MAYKDNLLEELTNLSSDFTFSISKEQSTLEREMTLISFYCSVKAIANKFSIVELNVNETLDMTDLNSLFRECCSIIGIIKALAVSGFVNFKNHNNVLGYQVTLDENWKTRVRSYVNIIKEDVEKNINDYAFKTSILGKLNSFLSEVDKNQTSLRSFNEAFVEITYAIGLGFENLQKPIMLCRKLISGLSKLHNIENPALPSPDDTSSNEIIYLPKPENIKQED